MNHLRPFATDREIEYLDAIEKNGNKHAAAKALGVDNKAIHNAIMRLERRAAKQGVSPDHDMTHEAAPGFAVKGTSTLYDEEGKPKLQWVKTTQDQESRLEALLNVLDSYSWKPAPVIKCKGTHANQLLTLYTLTDFHLGCYAYAKETGDDWDVEIARNEAISAIARMSDGSPNSEHGILNIQGDFLHWDGLDAVTPTSGHILDADTRFGKLIDLSLDVILGSVEILLKKHKTVKVLICEGNHDIASSAWIRKAIKKIFRKNPRVEIDDTEFPYYAHLHGQIMLAFHHGHKTKNKSLPSLFSSEPRYRAMWGQSKYTYIHTGHYHHAEQDMAEHGGAIVERHPTLAGRDAYAARGGYVSWKAAHAITYDKDKGEVSRVTVTPEAAA